MAFIVRAVRAGIDAHNDFKSAPTNSDPELLREMRAPKRGIVYGPAYDLMMKFENSMAKGENKVTPFIDGRSGQASGNGSGAGSRALSSPTDENGGGGEIGGSASSSRSSSMSRQQRRRLPPPLPPPREPPQRTESGGSDTHGDGAGPSGSGGGSSRWRPLPSIPTLGRRSGRRVPPPVGPVPALADLMMNTALANGGSAGPSPSSSASPAAYAAGSELQGVGTGNGAVGDAPDADDAEAPLLLRLARVPVLHQSTPDEPPERPSKDTAEDPPPPYAGHTEHYLLASAVTSPTRRGDELTRTSSSPP